MYFEHVKTGGVYQLQMLVTNEADLAPTVIYSDAQTGKLWSRPASEFFDGRFKTYLPPRTEEEAEMRAAQSKGRIQ